MQYMETFAVCFENYMKDINTVRCQNAEVSNVRTGENIVTTGL
jgi:hypothetical protein